MIIFLAIFIVVCLFFLVYMFVSTGRDVVDYYHDVAKRYRAWKKR